MILEAAMADAGTQLAVLAGKGTAAIVGSKFQSIRAKKQHEEICNSYEELINELVADRAQAIAIAQAYEAELDRYQITDEDIVHLQKTVSNALDLIASFSPTVKAADLKPFKDLISVDTLKSMQLLGFDYKAAIGAPLTKACAEAIEAKLKVSPSKPVQKKSGK